MSAQPRTVSIALASAFALVAVGCTGSAPTDSPGTGEAATASSEDPEPTQLGDGYASEVELQNFPPLEIPEDSPKVLFIGDSITAGLHLPADHAWPAALQRSLFTEGIPFRLQNAGVSGDTSAGGLRRTDWLLKGSPDIVVIELGPNDGLRGNALEDTERNLRAIIEKVQAAGAQPILIGMDVPTNLDEYAQEFSAIYPRLAAEFEIPLVPSFFEGVGGHPDMNLRDGMHPTPAGHERLAQNAKAILHEALTARKRDQ